MEVKRTGLSSVFKRPGRFHLFLSCAFAACIFFPAATSAQDWYRSNPSGMALERAASRMMALRNEWALSVKSQESRNLPGLLRPFYKSVYTMEERLLYREGQLKRRQWIFRSGGVTRLNASLPADLASAEKGGTGGEIPPFIEFFNSDRTLVETRQYLASGIYVTRYSYREGLLVIAETSLDNKALWTDHYRYTRSALLRGVERNYHEAGIALSARQGRDDALPSGRPGLSPTEKPGEMSGGDAQAVPPGSVAGLQGPAALDLRTPPPVPGFVNPGPPFDSGIANVLGSIYAVSAAKIMYDTDSQGRVIAETHYDSEGKVIAEIRNEWSGSRINRIDWLRYDASGNTAERGHIVFRYSGGDRIGEEDWRNGVLERKLFREGDNDIEEIYMNGKTILRAVWQDGRKISEERLR